MNTKNNSSKTSIIIAIAIFIVALMNLSSSTFSFILITISAIIVSPLSKKIFKSLTKQKLLLLRVTSPIIAILWGVIISSSADENEKSTAENKELKIVQHYLRNHKDMVAIKQIDSIYHLHDYFEGAYKNDSDLEYLQKLLKPTKKHLDQYINNRNAYSKKVDSINNTSTIIYNPHFLVKSISNEFQNEIGGKLISKCELLFDFNSNQELNSTKTILTYSNGTKAILDSLEIYSVFKFIDLKKIKNQKKYIKARIKIAQHEVYAKNFESNCFSGWNGSNNKLVDITKNAMHDPKSFEHVETTYTIKNDYSIVTMRYRGKNKFNATVTNTIKAKVRISDCEILKVW